MVAQLNGSRCHLVWRVGSVEGWVYQMGVVIIKGEGVLWANLGRPIVTNREFAMRLFQNYFGQDLSFLCFQSTLVVHYCTKFGWAMGQQY